MHQVQVQQMLPHRVSARMLNDQPLPATAARDRLVQTAIDALRSPRLSPASDKLMYRAALEFARRVSWLLTPERPKTPSGDKARRAVIRWRHVMVTHIASCHQMGDSTLPSWIEEALCAFHAAVKMLKTFRHTFKLRELVFHIASVARMYEELAVVGENLVRVMAMAGMAETDVPAPEWEGGEWSWQAQLLLERCKEEDALANEAGNHAAVLPFVGTTTGYEDMTLLRVEIDNYNSGNSKSHMDTMKRVFFGLVRSSHGLAATIPEWYSYVVAMPVPANWFVPREEIDLDVDEVDPIAAGSFSNVYRSTLHETPVAVKCFKSETETARVMLSREVSIWSRLRHRHIVPFIGACNVGSPWFIVCEFAGGGTLRDYLRQQHQAGRPIAWRKLYEVSLGLLYLHKKGIVHADLKTDNIVVSKEGRAMVTDFGLSFDQRHGSFGLKELGAMRYRAPEYALTNGQGPSFEADVYSLGACIIETVSGKLPWGNLVDAAVTYYLSRRRTVPVPTNLTCPKCLKCSDWPRCLSAATGCKGCSNCTDCPAVKLVQEMCAFDPATRTPLVEVVAQLKVLADDEEDLERRKR